MEGDSGSPKVNKGNKRAKKNQTIFAILLIVVQALLSTMYGLFCQAPISLPNISSILSAIFLAFLVIAGFGLYFSYFKNLIWSGIGFSLLITALSIQIYPLVNALWAKLNLHKNGIYEDSFSKKGFNLFLASMDSNMYQSNTITSAIKCALALIVTFGSVIGRVGPLECLIMSVFGIIAYELNRNIILNFGQDIFGTFSVFTFGGFFGITFGTFLTIRERKKRVKSKSHAQLNGNTESITHSIFGGIFIFILLPYLAFQGDQSFVSNLFSRYNAPVSVFLSMGTAVMTSIAIGMLVNGDSLASIRIKDLLNSLVAGGVIIGAASFYATTPFLAIVCGATSAVLQYFFDNFIQQKLYERFGLLSTHSFTVFCLQGLAGAAFATGYNSKIANNTIDGFTFAQASIQGPGYQFVIYFISAAIGIGCGIITGIPCYCLNKYRTEDLFHDRVEFKPEDGIFYHIKKQKSDQIKINVPKTPQQTEEILGEEQRYIQNVADKRQDEHISQQYISSLNEIQFDFADMLQVVIQ